MGQTGPPGQVQDMMEKFVCLADENESIAADLCRETAGAAVRYGTVELRTRREAVQDDGYVDNADGYDAGHGPCLASRDPVSGARDCGMHQVPALVTEMQPPAPLWLLGLRVYVAMILTGNLLLQLLHLPLYAIWTAGTLMAHAFAPGHCTLRHPLIPVTASIPS